MDCDAALDELPDLVLGVLSGLVEEQIRGHIRGCAECRARAIAVERGLFVFGLALHASPPPP